MHARLIWMLWLLFTLHRAPVVHMCYPPYGLVHVEWEHQHEVQYQLDCNTWSYFCEDSGWSDKEATVLCREQGYSYGISGYVPTGGVYDMIHSIECEGSEGRLQDCVIEVASSTSHNVCTLIGTVTCHNNVPEIYISVNKDSVSENGSFMVCVHVNGTLSPDATVSIQTFDITAIADFDYLPVGRQLEFVASGGRKVCVSIDVVDDLLAEPEEWFGIKLSVEPSFLVHSINTQLHLKIEPSDGVNICTEGSVSLVSDVNNSSLQLVEMCSSEGVWSPVCDTSWTIQDATVVCRELGYSDLGKIVYHIVESSNAKIIAMYPECNGDESKLVHCMEKFDENNISGHHHMLVDCSHGSNETDEDEKSNTTIQQQPPSDNGEANNEDEEYPVDELSFDLGVILGMVAVTLAVILLVLVSVIAMIVCLWQLRKKRGKSLPQSLNSQQENTADQNESILGNTLFINHHTNPTSIHTYSSIIDPSPSSSFSPTHHHEYATLEITPSVAASREEPNNMYHVLEQGPSIHHYDDIKH